MFVDLQKIFSYIAGCRICTQIGVGFLHTNSEPSEKDIRKTIPFTILQTIKIPRNKFNEISERSI
jgi:hypothetical protein